MKEKRKNEIFPRWSKWIAVGLIISYGLAVVLPYAFPPASDVQQVDALMNRETRGDFLERAGILETGDEALWGRMYLMDHARHHLRLTSYLYACDESGEKIGAALLRAADRGVKVQLLVDGLIGGIQFAGEILPYALGNHENIEIRYYNPLHLWHPASINARLHEKYFIADDQCLILGGRNISNEFLTPQGHPDYNMDRDVMLFADGQSPDSGVAQAVEYFDALWHSADVVSRFESGGDERRITQCRQEMEEKLRQIEDEKESWYSRIEGDDFAVSVEKAILLSNPHHPGVKSPVLFDALCNLMKNAGDRIMVQSPYFVLDGYMQNRLQQVADQPSHMTLYTNSMASGNNIVASADYLWQKGRVTGMEAALYESQADDSSHTKCILIDENLSIFGSFNFDPRSAYIDTEVMMAVYSEELNRMLEEKMDRAADDSLRVMENGYEERTERSPAEMEWGKKIMIYLLSPLVFPLRFLL